jgi:hypothetical protein
MFSIMPVRVTLAAWAYSANGRAATRRSACRRTSRADSGSVGLTCGVGEGFDGSRVTAWVWPSGQAGPMRRVDDSLAPTRRLVMAGEPGAAVRGEGVNADLVFTGRADVEL